MPKSKSYIYFDNQVNLRYVYLDWDNRHKSAMQNIGVKIDPNVNVSSYHLGNHIESKLTHAVNKIEEIGKSKELCTGFMQNSQ